MQKHIIKFLVKITKILTPLTFSLEKGIILMKKRKKNASTRSPLQKKSLEKARQSKEAKQASLKSTQPIDPQKYCLAVLSEGLGETEARRFLSKLDITPPTTYEFYQAQNNLLPKIKDLAEHYMEMVRQNLPPNSIFGLDCSWSARRNASHAIVIFMEMRTHLIFDKVIISRTQGVGDVYFEGPSNLMENIAVKQKKDYYIQNYHFIGFVHDFDIDTAPILQPDELTGQLIELLDRNHLKKVIQNIFDNYNKDNHLYQLKDTIVRRFSAICAQKNITVEEKINRWRQTPTYIIEKEELPKGYLINPTKQKEAIFS